MTVGGAKHALPFKTEGCEVVPLAAELDDQG